MAFMLFSIDEAVDHKYIVNKTMKEQAKKGTLIHVMDARETSDGITVYYRINRTKQDYIARFDSIKQFCKWCIPSTFLAKYYDRLTAREINRYIKVENRSFVTFQLPLILLFLVIIWLAVLAVMKFELLDMMLALIIGGAASVVAIIAVLVISRVAKANMIERLYQKVSSMKKISSMATYK